MASEFLLACSGVLRNLITTYIIPSRSGDSQLAEMQTSSTPKASVASIVAEDELLNAFSPSPRHQQRSGYSQQAPPATQQKKGFGAFRSIQKGGSHSKMGNNQDDDDEVLTDHKVQQRQKQIQYGFNTKGHQNMQRLLESDPRLSKGGVLPLQPPPATLRTSKRAWDVLARKWRRALHLFDDVFIDSTDHETTTLEAVIEEQRKKWVSPKYAHLPKESRTKVTREALLAARLNPSVPKRLPVEECMKPILRSPDCFEDLTRVVPDSASSLIKGNTGVSPTDAGIKIFIAPSAEASLFNHFAGDATRSPSPDMAVTPSTIAQMRACSPLYQVPNNAASEGTCRRSASPNPSPSTAALSSSRAWSSETASRSAARLSSSRASRRDDGCGAIDDAVAVVMHAHPANSRLSPLAAPFQPHTRPTRDFSPNAVGDHHSHGERVAARLEQSFQSAANTAATFTPPPPFLPTSKKA